MSGDPHRPRLRARRKVGGAGDPVVFVADEQTAVIIDAARWADLAEQVLIAEGVRGNTELSLLFVEEEDIAELNLQFLGKGGPTDVLAFPIDADEIAPSVPPMADKSGPDRSPLDREELPLLLGDIVVCPVVALRQAPTHAGTPDDELALPIVHGLLHVLGHDHAEPEETAVMRNRERELLEEFHWHAPAPAAFRQEHDE
jgi:probable rRNA maturation factor